MIWQGNRFSLKVVAGQGKIIDDKATFRFGLFQQRYPISTPLVYKLCWSGAGVRGLRYRLYPAILEQLQETAITR